MSSEYRELGPTITSDIGWRVWRTPANFDWFRILASLLQLRHSPDTNQTLRDVWPSHALVLHCIHFRAFSPDGILRGANLRSSLAFSYIGSVTARYSSSWRQPNFASFSRRRHLYSTGRPSHYASAHILVIH